MIRKIIQLISSFPLVSARTEEQFYGDMEAFVVHGANTTVSEQNQLRNEINNTVDDINGVLESISNNSIQIANDKTTVNQAKLDAQSARDSAIAANNAAQAIYDNFDDRYLGTHATAPTVDNDGNALRMGALYFNSTNSKMYVYDATGAKWVDMMYIPTLLSSLSDIVFGSKSNNDVIQYDSATGKWVNRSFYSKDELDAFINIHSKTAKTTPADADEITLADSTSSFSLKKISWANIKSLFANRLPTSTLNALVKFGDTVGTLKNTVGAYLTDTGNMLIGTTVDNGIDKLQVNGSITSKRQNGIVLGFVLCNISFNDNSAHTLPNSLTGCNMIVEIVSTSGLHTFPLYPFGGAGFVWRFNYLNPSTGTWINTSGNNLSLVFTEQGASPNTYAFSISSGTGIATIQATTKNSPYTITITTI